MGWWGKIASVLTVIGVLFSAYFYIDNQYASAHDLHKVECRLDYKIVSDQLQSVQQQIWNLEDQIQLAGESSPEVERVWLRRLKILRAQEAQLKTKHDILIGAVIK